MDIIKQRVKQDNDAIILLTGYEGTGKSTLGLHSILYMDDHLGEVVENNPRKILERVAFTPRDVYRTLYKLEPGEAFMVDEGANMLFSRDAMTSTNKKLVKTLMTAVRTLNLIMVINIQNIAYVDSYIRDHRALCWLHVIKRGKFGFFSKRQLKELVAKASKKGWKNIRYDQMAYFYDDFPKLEGPVWMHYYMKKKEYSRAIVAKHMEDYEEQKNWYSVPEVAEITGLTRAEIINFISTGVIKGTSLGHGSYMIHRRELENIRRQLEKAKIPEDKLVEKVREKAMRYALRT